MASEIASLEAEIREYKLQLETVALALQNDPDSSELQSLQSELHEVITLTESAIAELKPAQDSVKPATPITQEKWSRNDHPAYKAGYKPPEAEVEEAPTQPVFSVNETVLARWKTGDGGFYNARITSKTGSQANPVYTVLFNNYNTTETCRSKDIRPLSVEAKKRKADSMSGSSTPVQSANPNVISAAPTVDPSLAQQVKKEPSKVSDGPVRPAKIPKQIGAKNVLEANKSKWQDFNTKSKGKYGGKKDSMFRTGDGVSARGKHT